jgi:hypothetical protein
LEFIAQEFFAVYKMTMRLLFFLLSISPLSAMLIGDPAQPALQTSGMFSTRPSWVSFRAGYLDDWIYQEQLRDDIEQPTDKSGQTRMQLSTYASLLTLNFTNRIDFYGIVGSSRMQLDEEMFTKGALSWGAGGKIIIFEEGNFFIGADFKYFQTDQKPRYLVFDGQAYNFVGDFRLRYTETQAAVGMAYRILICTPYIYGTYLISKLEPQPSTPLARLPDEDELADVPLRRSINQDRWGLALGLTLIDQAKATLAVEWRGFNQNAVDWNFEFRF